MGSIFAQMGSLFAQISTPNPRPLLCRHTPLSGICMPVYIKRPPAHVGECWPKPEFTLSKTLGGSQMVVLRFTTLSARDRHWRNPRRKNYTERSNIKSARVSALTGSVPRKMADAQQRVSAFIINRTQVARLSATNLNHLAIGSNWLLGKKGIWLVTFRHLLLIFWRTGLSYSDFSSWISRPDTKYENSWTQGSSQTFDRYILSHST